jgi:hypothetical protein
MVPLPALWYSRAPAARRPRPRAASAGYTGAESTRCQAGYSVRNGRPAESFMTIVRRRPGSKNHAVAPHVRKSSTCTWAQAETRADFRRIVGRFDILPPPGNPSRNSKRNKRNRAGVGAVVRTFSPGGKFVREIARLHSPLAGPACFLLLAHRPKKRAPRIGAATSQARSVPCAARAPQRGPKTTPSLALPVRGREPVLDGAPD